jgi:hypothetical protein
VRIKGTWKYLHRAVDKAGATVDFLLTAKRDRKAAARFLRKAIGRNGTPEKITIDKSGANKAAIENHNADLGACIEIRQIKYQQHRRTGPSGYQALGAANAGVQILQVSRRDACRHRTHAHDPEGPVAKDRRNVSGAAILFVGWINQTQTYCWASHIRQENLRQNPNRGRRRPDPFAVVTAQ